MVCLPSGSHVTSQFTRQVDSNGETHPAIDLFDCAGIYKTRRFAMVSDEDGARVVSSLNQTKPGK